MVCGLLLQGAMEERVRGCWEGGRLAKHYGGGLCYIQEWGGWVGCLHYLLVELCYLHLGQGLFG